MPADDREERLVSLTACLGKKSYGPSTPMRALRKGLLRTRDCMAPAVLPAHGRCQPDARSCRCLGDFPSAGRPPLAGRGANAAARPAGRPVRAWLAVGVQVTQQGDLGAVV